MPSSAVCPEKRARLAGPDIRIRDGKIAAIGSLTPLPEERQIDARDCVIYPAWVNTHHHLFQSLLKGEPQGLNQSLTAWLSATPYRFRAAFDEHTFRLAVRIGLVELLRSGCASVGGSQLPVLAGYAFRYLGDCLQRRGSAGDAHRPVPGWGDPGPGGGTGICRWRCVPETFDGYMADVERLVSRYHDPRPESLRRVVMGAHYRPALRAGRPAAGDGEAGPPAGDPVAQPFIGNRRLSRRPRGRNSP
ncbi:amidohydrolase [Klebsiella pneumoniae]|nr:amidohydrolase [Klebsiella pneumoniae]